MNHIDARFSASCPSPETLTAFLAASAALPPQLVGEWSSPVGDDEMRGLSAHVAACDHCVEELRVVSRRLALAAAMPLPVPPGLVRQTVAAIAPAAASVPAAAPGWLTGMREWLLAGIRMPVLAPAALAALALIVVVPRLQAPPDSSQELSRAVELRQVARVTVDGAAVRAERTAAAAVLMTLVRGDRAVLVGEQDGWYRVALADGTEGWIERSAFD